MNKRTGKSSRKYDFNLCLPHTNAWYVRWLTHPLLFTKQWTVGERRSYTGAVGPLCVCCHVLVFRLPHHTSHHYTFIYNRTRTISKPWTERRLQPVSSVCHQRNGKHEVVLDSQAFSTPKPGMRFLFPLTNSGQPTVNQFTTLTIIRNTQQKQQQQQQQQDIIHTLITASSSVHNNFLSISYTSKGRCHVSRLHKTPQYACITW